MFSLRFARIPTGFRTCLKIQKHSSSAVQVSQNSENNLINNVSEEVEYPEILDLSFPAQQLRKFDEMRQFIQRQKTIEEKLIALNMPRYYGFYAMQMLEHEIHYNTLDQTQFLTRTHIMPTNELPSFYNDLISSEKLDEIVANVRSQIEDVLVLEYSKRNIKKELSADVLSDPEKLQNFQTKAIIRQINRIFLLELSSKYPHLLDTEIDYDPRIEAYWVVGGMEPPKSVKCSRQNSIWQKEYANDPIDRRFQYIGEPCLQLRHALPLQEIIPYQEAENQEYNVPEFRYDPFTVGYYRDLKRATSIPGFWPGDKREFGLLSYHHCGYMAKRPREYDDEEDALKIQAIRASFAWLNAQAAYQGFSTYNDITYPLVTQNIILNGQWWYFSAYQLNTMLLCNHHINDNPKRNFYWTTGPMQLFEKIEDNKVHGLNDEVLKNLIKFYVNKPQPREENLKPYLGEDEKVVADIVDDERRKWLEQKFKHLMSNRKYYKNTPEIYNWQQIFIRKHKKRPMEKKLELWQKGENFMSRRLDDHRPRYIPKCLRAFPKSKAKFANQFYPK
ncbi:28S ribosomal protein S30, mitochondrial [Leptopilina boulardi]|uniref:28S ribosomal protein S30, mitochondrial n=1 Tax=Leptopilina boulardi TaxID=63433 RepID=UPI0021F5BA07|nr:28S ribosomal protein S30, mitochondrial [Leptopilina boulardi]